MPPGVSPSRTGSRPRSDVSCTSCFLSATRNTRSGPFHMQNKGATILAVDDSPATLQVLTRHLVKAGYVLHTCASVEEAGDFLGRTVVDLVITDY